VGDEDEAGGNLLLDALEEVHDIRLGQHIQGGGGFVQNHQVGQGDQCHGNCHALAHTAGKLKCIPVDKINRDAHPLEHGFCLLEGGFLRYTVVNHHRLGNLVAHL